MRRCLPGGQSPSLSAAKPRTQNPEPIGWWCGGAGWPALPPHASSSLARAQSSPAQRPDSQAHTTCSAPPARTTSGPPHLRPVQGPLVRMRHRPRRCQAAAAPASCAALPWALCPRPAPAGRLGCRLLEGRARRALTLCVYRLEPVGLAAGTCAMHRLGI